MKTGDIIAGTIISVFATVLFVSLSYTDSRDHRREILNAIGELSQAQQTQQVTPQPTVPPQQAAPKGISDLLRAMAIEESGSTSDSDIPGDDGKSLGPLQICWKYWDDADMPDGTYNDCVSYKYACRVAIRYWKRYCPEALANVDCKVLVRIHNGGPTGDRKSSTLKHWAKVQKELER